MDQKINCLVKIIVNPQLENSFNLQFNLTETPIAKFKIILNHAKELNLVLDNIRKYLPIKFNFNVIFNWKNTPKIIRTNKQIQNEIIDILESSLNNYNKVMNLIEKYNIPNKSIFNNKNSESRNKNNKEEDKNNKEKNKK